MLQLFPRSRGALSVYECNTYYIKTFPGPLYHYMHTGALVFGYHSPTKTLLRISRRSSHFQRPLCVTVSDPTVLGVYELSLILVTSNLFKPQRTRLAFVYAPLKPSPEALLSLHWILSRIPETSQGR